MVVTSGGQDWKPFQIRSLSRGPFPHTGVHMVGKLAVRILLECFLVIDHMHKDLRYGRDVRSEQIKPRFIIKRI